MKSTLLKTLAAVSLMATSHAEIHVMGASWKERGVSAPNGDIEPNPGTVAAPRAYLIMDDTIRTAAPNAATYIEYGERRGNGSVERYYTIDSDFRDFLADSVFGDSGGRRLYGHMHVPLTISTVPNPMIPFSGTSFSTDFPRKISFDQTVFQNGASDTVTGPQIVLANSSTLRSVISGSANPVKVSGTDFTSATNELVARLFRQGYKREVTEAPTFVDDLDAALTLLVGEQEILSVTVGSDTIPGPIPGTNPVEFDDFAAPTFQWLKNDVVIPGAVGSTYTVTGGTSTATNGYGNYKVVATNVNGSTTSTTTVVTPTALAFATHPATPAAPIIGAGTTTLTATLNPAPVTAPTFQWMKAPTATPTVFTAVPVAAGGNLPSLLVVGNEPATGAGVYRLDVTSPAGTIQSNTATVTVNAAGTAFVFTLNSPKTVSVAFAGTAPIGPVVNSAAGTPAVQSRQWSKAPLNNPTVFTDVLAGDGGTSATLNVNGNNASPTGPGVYRMTATSVGATPTVITTIDTVVTTAP